ncbi:MAG: bifunctional alpha/beta hydrolase/OsmC family protein, partial [bacterium]
ITSMGKALLILHGPGDEIVGIDNASKIFAAARHPKSFVSLDDADHLLTRREDAAYVAVVLAAWATRYLGTTELSADTTAAIPPGVVVVEETGVGTFAERVRVGAHVLAADEPLSVGGTDTGPGPYDYLLAGLGACTAMTLRMYADRKQLPLDRISVRLGHGKIYAVDCEGCETREGMIDRIERNIEVKGVLSEEQRSKLLEIAGKCPVHRTLTSEIDIQTRLTE